MSITVELTYEMSKALGEARIEIEQAATVGDAIDAARQKFGADTASFDQLARVAAVAVNGVLMSYRKGRKTSLEPGDTVSFVKAAAGG